MYRTVLDRLSRTHLEDLILGEGLLAPDRMEAAQAEQDQTGATLSDVLLDSQTLEEWDLAKLVAARYSLPFVDLKLYSIPPGALDLLPLDWCRKHSVLPFDVFGKSLVLACVEVPKAELLQEITERTGCTAFLYVCLRRALRDVIDENLKRRAKSAPTAAAAPAAKSPPAPKPAPAASEAPAPVPAPPPAPAAPAAAAAPARAPHPPLPSIADLPRVSLQLNATAAPAVAAPAPKKPVIERFTRPATPSPAVAGTVPKHLSPMQQILGRPSPDAPKPAEPATLPTLPRATVRAVPSLPSKPPVPAKSSAALKSTHSGDGWESIFDLGEDAVRRTSSSDG